MNEKSHWIWVERIFHDSLNVNYKIYSILIGTLIFLLFLISILSNKISYLPWDIYTVVPSLALSLLITIQLAGIKYFLSNIRDSFMIIDSMNKINEKVFSDSKRLYVIIALFILLIFFVAEFNNNSIFAYWLADRTIPNLIFDIYNHLTISFMLLLLAANVWIIINLSISINRIKAYELDIHIELNIFDIDRLCGLSPIRDLVINYFIYYFICISLAIISYVNPFSLFNSFFTIILISLLVFGGFCLLFIGLNFIRRILNKKVAYESDLINKRYKNYKNKLKEIDIEGGTTVELACISSILTNIFNERQLIASINKRGYNHMTIFYLITSAISPILSAIIPVLFPLL